MELGGAYNPIGIKIEGNIRKEYENAFKKLTQANSLEESLESVGIIFKSLEKSKPNKEEGMDWARDMIQAYRTLGKMFHHVYFELEYGEEEKKNYLKLLDFDGTTDEENIKQALEYLLDVKRILREYNIVDREELETKLERLIELEESQENTEKLEKLKRKVEEFENNFF